MLGHHLYAAAGFNYAHDQTYISSMESLDLSDANAVWSTSVALPYGLRYTSCATVNNSVVLTGGDKGNRGGPTSAVFMWKEGDTQWTALASMPHTRTDHCTVSDGGRYVYTLGGESGVAVSPLECYDTMTDTWKNLSPMSSHIYSHRCVYVDGTIVVTGGYVSGVGGVDAIHLYNVASDTWASSPVSLPQPIRYHFMGFFPKCCNTLQDASTSPAKTTIATSVGSTLVHATTREGKKLQVISLTANSTYFVCVKCFAKCMYLYPL
jgi:hypothetical protein